MCPHVTLGDDFHSLSESDRFTELLKKLAAVLHVCPSAAQAFSRLCKAVARHVEARVDELGFPTKPTNESREIGGRRRKWAEVLKEEVTTSNKKVLSWRR